MNCDLNNLFDLDKKLCNQFNNYHAILFEDYYNYNTEIAKLRIDINNMENSEYKLELKNILVTCDIKVNYFNSINVPYLEVLSK